MKQEEKEAQQQADQAVLHVQAHAHAGGEVSHQGFDDAEHAQRILGKRILRQADQGAHHQPADLAAPHNGEIDHHQQRHLQKTQEREKHGDVDLEQDGRQRHTQQYPGTKPGDLTFTLAAEQDPLARVGHQRSCPPADGPAD